jgi:hypothetical protein
MVPSQLIPPSGTGRASAIADVDLSASFSRSVVLDHLSATSGVGRRGVLGIFLSLQISHPTSHARVRRSATGDWTWCRGEKADFFVKGEKMS